MTVNLFVLQLVFSAIADRRSLMAANVKASLRG